MASFMQSAPCSTPLHFIERGIINTIFHAAGAVSLGWFVYHYIKTYRSQSSETKQRILSNKCLHCSALTHFTMAMITFIAFGVGGVFQCIYPIVYIITTPIGLSCASIQYALLIYIFFYRLRVVFDDTPFEVSRLTMRLFHFLYCLWLFLFSIVYFVSGTGKIIILGAIFLVQLTIITWLIGIFIYKVIQVAKTDSRTNAGDDQTFSHLITKVFILTLASILTTLFMAIMLAAILSNSSGIEVEFWTALAVAIDLTTNYLAIVFGLQRFERQYMAVCGICHRNCLGCCDKIMKNKNVMELSNSVQNHEMQSKSDPDLPSEAAGATSISI
eukprot:603326_1